MKLSKIKPNPNNPRLVKDDKFSKLVESLKSFGEKMMPLRPMVIDENNILLGGNMRYKALKELGYKEVPDNWVKQVLDLTEEEKQEFIIKDNVGFGAWDWDALANEWDVESLEAWGLDIPDFEDETILEAEEDDYEEPEQVQVDIVEGDLVEFICNDGRVHRLLCGDSTDSDAVAKLMNKEKADMVFTDPPYNISFSGSMSNTTKGGVMVKHKGANQLHEAIHNDKMSDEDFYNFMGDIVKQIKINCNGAYYICFGSQTLNQLLQPFLDLGLEYKSIIIWMKNQATLSGKDYKSRYEPILYGRFNDGFYGERYKQEDIWEFQRTLKNDLHPTMKPIPLINNAIINSSKKGMLILDFFLGSGSTIVASHQANRVCYGAELDPKYCQVIVDRMMKLDSSIKVKINGKDYEGAETPF